MELQEIDLIIEPDSQVRVEVRGIKGRRCLDATKDLERALGGQVVARELTAEACEVAQGQAQESLSQQGGR
jgi:hypothetical protein